MKARSIDRRTAIKTGAAAVAVVAAAGTLAKPYIARAQEGPIKVPPLPYKDDALAPVISANQIGFHYGKHHVGYQAPLNALLAGAAKDYAGMSLEEMIKTSRANPNRTAVFNNAAQIWNHTFYWNGMKPGGGGEPGGKLKDEIGKAFGDFAKFKAELARTTIGQFGSGWGWLVWDGKEKKMALRATANAETPVGLPDVKALLTIDVWEHAYYLDYQNRRADYVNAVIDKLVNWEFVEKNMG